MQPLEPVSGSGAATPAALLRREAWRIAGALRGDPEASPGWTLPPASPRDDEGDAFVLLLKPELFAADNGPVLLGRLLDLLDEARVTVCAVRFWSGLALARRRAIEACYLPLNRTARLGAASLSAAQLAALHAALSPPEAPLPVFGAEAFLRQHPELGAPALAERVHAVGHVKLGAGAYAARLGTGRGAVVVLNGFHPHQRAHLTAPDAVLVALDCRSLTALPRVRMHLVGMVDPDRAAPGSFRRWLAEAARGFRPDAMLNGVHVSPGPFEAAHHLNLFFPGASGTRPGCAGTGFARALASVARPSERTGIDRLLELRSDRERDAAELVALFDATEGTDTPRCLALLRERTRRAAA